VGQIFVTTWIIDKYGALWPFKIFSFYFAASTALLPFLNLLVPYGSTIVMITLCSFFFIRCIFDITTFTAVFLFVNHSADPDITGTANGIAQSFASLGRGLGPLLGGIMLTWSLNTGWFPFDHYFTYFVLAFCLFLMTGISFALDNNINHRKIAHDNHIVNIKK